ncbi:MAG: hypothetical protein ACP5LD_14775, partial [Desulfomonilaceae bacterium]
MLRAIFLVGMVFVFMSHGVCGMCQSVPGFSPSIPSLPGLCKPHQPKQVQPVARTVQVTVPAPRPAPPAAPPGCGPMSSLCPPFSSQARDTRPTPVRVEVAVRPEGPEQRSPVPVVYRDPGFLGPMIRHGVGLVGATVAAPFRVAEMLLPVQAPQTLTSCGVGCGQGPCPAPRPARPCSPLPPAPSLAPLPRCAVPSCGPYMPPAKVERPEEPAWVPQSLLGGVLNVPFVLLERGRI